MTIEEVKQKITPILQASDIAYAGVFGSVARGEAGEDSDIDLAVKFSRPPGLFKFVRVKLDLEKTLHKSVDLVSYTAIKPNLKPNIVKDLKDIYGQRPNI